MTNKKTKAWIITALLVLLALLSILAAVKLSQPGTYESTFAAIDEKFSNVLSLAGVTVTASSAITLLPDDVGTPIATQLAEYTDYFLVIVSILLAEKYLVTIFAAIAFFLMMPAAFLASIPFFAWKFPSVRDIMWKIALLFLALYLVIPASMKISRIIEKTYDISIESAITSVSELGGIQAEEEQALRDESGGLGALWGKVTDTVTSVTDNLTDIPQKASKAVNDMIQALAVMIVTSCIIPLLVLFISFWIIKTITGAERSPRHHHKALPPRRESPKHLEEREDALTTV